MSYTKLSSHLLLSISVLALAACGGEPTRGAPSSKTAAPLPPVSETTTTTAQSVPVSDTLSAVDTVAAPPINATAADLSMEARMEKLEAAVGSLRTDYDRIMPAFASLNSTNERIQTLLDQIERETIESSASASSSAIAPAQTVTTTTTKVTPSSVMEPEKGLKIEETKIVQEANAAHADPEERVTPVEHAVVKATPIDAKVNPDGSPVKKAAVSTSATPSATNTAALTPEEATRMAIAQTGGQSVASNVRIGEHPGKTRLVLDLSKDAKPDFKTDVDNAEHLMTIELPGVTWGGATEGGPKGSAYISRWSASKTDGGGSTLAVQLKKNAKILSTQYLKPEKGDPARLVIDIGPAT